MRWRYKATFFLMFIFIMSGCSMTTEEAVQQTYERFIDSFQQEKKEANTTTEQVALYLPRGIALEVEEDYNLVFKKGDRLYILFFNPHEPLHSTVNAERDQEVTEGRLLFETIEHEGKFGYLSIVEDGEDWKLIVGIGGAKMSTLTEKKHIVEDVDYLLHMLHSLEFVEQ